MEKKENKDFLTTQIITYLGNKRSLLGNIEKEVIEIENKIGSKKLVCADIFSGSGIVARMLKKHSSKLIVNDLENYSSLINSCYLINKNDYPSEICAEFRKEIERKCEEKKYTGIISKNYAPQDDNNILQGERVFYTHENAVLIDTYRKLIDEIVNEESLKKFFLAPLITEASIHVNTSGVFKGFYKDKDGVGKFGGQGENALRRILGKIELKMPIFSNFQSEFEVFQNDALEFAKSISKVDIAYFDPPYNQHPYGSNYFMLNLISDFKTPNIEQISKVSGIPNDWNRSKYNKKAKASDEFFNLLSEFKAKYLIISFNSEGFISESEFLTNLNKIGKAHKVEIKYPTYRASRNLNSRDLYVTEYLYIIKKDMR